MGGQPPGRSRSHDIYRPRTESGDERSVADVRIETIDLLGLPVPQPLAVGRLPDDAQLVAACRRGDARAMEALYHQYKRRVFGLVYRIVGASDAEEVAQDVFVRVFRGLPQFRGDSAL